MNIAFYAPLKPQGTGPPSGDDSTASGLVRFLRGKGHALEQISELGARNIFQNSSLLRRVSEERHNALARARDMRADIWLSFHSYWKAPDLLGPWCCRRLGIPYVMHKGMHALKRKRVRSSLPGFLVNQKALLQANKVFTDDANDLHGLGFLPGNKVDFLPPGIDTSIFYPDEHAGNALRRKYGIEHKMLVAVVSMLRPGVKTQSIKHLLESLAAVELDFHLLIAGDGPTSRELQSLARKLLPRRCTFVGLQQKNELRALYSAADVFAFPGIGESLGMVYLEAMCCGTPVVAYMGTGPSQLVRQGKTGLLAASMDCAGFRHAVEQLLLDKQLRTRLGQKGRTHVLEHHELGSNLAPLESAMLGLVGVTQGHRILFCLP